MSRLTMSTHRMFLLFKALLSIAFISANKIIVHDVFIDTKINCEHGEKYYYSTTSEIQCMHRCLWHQECNVINFRPMEEHERSNEKNCEVFEILDNDSSCIMLDLMTNWTAMIVEREEDQAIGSQGNWKEVQKDANNTIEKIKNVTKVYHSCKELHEDKPNLGNGNYQLVSGEHFCLMTDVVGCSGGGWTGVLKVDGAKHTFEPKSPHWTTYGVYNVENGLKYPNTAEGKFAAFNNMSFTAMCIGLRYAGVRNWLTIPFNGTSLLAIFQKESFTPINIGPAAWKSLIAGSSLNAYCNHEGFNVMKSGTKIVARIGIIGDNNNNCDSPSSFIGIGTSLESSDTCSFSVFGITSGNVQTCEGYSNNIIKAAMSFVLIR